MIVTDFSVMSIKSNFLFSKHTFNHYCINYCILPPPIAVVVYESVDNIV